MLVTRDYALKRSSADVCLLVALAAELEYSVHNKGYEDRMLREGFWLEDVRGEKKHYTDSKAAIELLSREREALYQSSLEKMGRHWDDQWSSVPFDLYPAGLQCKDIETVAMLLQPYANKAMGVIRPMMYVGEQRFHGYDSYYRPHGRYGFQHIHLETNAGFVYYRSHIPASRVYCGYGLVVPCDYDEMAFLLKLLWADRKAWDKFLS